MKKYYQQFFMNQSEVEYWDSIYDQQDFSSYCYRQRMGTAISWLDDLNLCEDSKILEAGCGAGRLSNYAVKKGYNVFGMDYSHGMLTKAGGICNSDDKPNVVFLQGDIEFLPLKASSFDVIVCLGVITYLESEGKALHELARALKPGGVLILSIFNKARLVKRLDLPLLLLTVFKRILNITTAFSQNGARIENAHQVTTYYIPKIQKSLELTGFTVLEYKTVPMELLTFWGKEIFPRKMATNITLFFEQFSNIPFIGSFGAMCVFKAKKNSVELNEI